MKVGSYYIPLVQKLSRDFGFYGFAALSPNSNPKYKSDLIPDMQHVTTHTVTPSGSFQEIFLLIWASDLMHNGTVGPMKV